MRRPSPAPCRALARAAVVAVLWCCLLAACSGGSEPASPTPSAPSVLTAPGLRCDVDRASPEARNRNERVGGLRTEAWVVRFAQSTRLGTVALVDGDLAAAYAELAADYEVAVVAVIQDDGDPGTIDGFAQVRDLVEATCG